MPPPPVAGMDLVASVGSWIGEGCGRGAWGGDFAGEDFAGEFAVVGHRRIHSYKLLGSDE